MIRIAAVGDVHYDRNPRKEMRARFERLHEHADVLLISGDLTQKGTAEEAKAVAQDLAVVKVPVITVLGNHDFHSDQVPEICRILRDSGVTPLEGESVVIQISGKRVGIVGLKGFGGGFFGACVTDFGEAETKRYARHAHQQANTLRAGLAQLESDFKIALMHFSPVEGTLLGEKREIYPFLGSYLLAEAIDEGGADAAFHGHAHHGMEKGSTPGGVPVRNVALTVIRHCYNVYRFDMARFQEDVSNPPGLV